MKEDLFYDNVNLVFNIVKRMNYSFYDQEDLIQAGLMGLNQASKRYDPSKNVTFSTYATYYIVGEIKKEIRDNRPIKLSKEIFRILRKLKTSDDNQSLDELSLSLEVSKESILLAMSYKDRVISLNTGEDELELLGLVEDKNQKPSYDIIRDLDNLSQEIIMLKYYKGYTQSEIAKILKLTQSKVSRLENIALKKIKNAR
jgi:RNA polymerase sporulation-specific sigma factor